MGCYSLGAYLIPSLIPPSSSAHHKVATSGDDQLRESSTGVEEEHSAMVASRHEFQRAL